MNVNSFIDNEIRFCIDQYRSASLSKNQLNEHLSIKKALFVVKEKRTKNLTLLEQIKSPQVMNHEATQNQYRMFAVSEQNSESQN